MLLSRSATVIVLAVIGLVFPHTAPRALGQETYEERVAEGKVVQDVAPAASELPCHATL